MDVIKVLSERYSSKDFDPNKKISEEDFAKVKEILRMSPSSTNLQPWHFVIASTEEGKNEWLKEQKVFSILMLRRF